MAPHGSLYLQVHDIGSLLVSSFPELEKQGVTLQYNLFLEGSALLLNKKKSQGLVLSTCN